MTLHLPHSLADVGDSRVYGKYCSARGGHLTRTNISGPNLPTGETEMCMQDDKLVFFSRWIVIGQVRCYGGFCSTDMAYDTVNLTPPVAVGQIPGAAMSELTSAGYRPVK